MNLPQSLPVSASGKLCMPAWMSRKAAKRFYNAGTGLFKSHCFAVSLNYCGRCTSELTCLITKDCFVCQEQGLRDCGQDVVYGRDVDISTVLKPKLESFKCCDCVRSFPNALPREIEESRDAHMALGVTFDDEVIQENFDSEEACDSEVSVDGDSSSGEIVLIQAQPSMPSSVALMSKTHAQLTVDDPCSSEEVVGKLRISFPRWLMFV